MYQVTIKGKGAMVDETNPLAFASAMILSIVFSMTILLVLFIKCV